MTKARSLARYAILVFAMLGGAGLAFLQTVQVPPAITFSPSDAPSLTFNGIVGERCERTFVITNTTNGKLRVQRFRFTGDQDWDPAATNDAKGVELGPNEQHIVRVAFQPKTAGATSQARVTFRVRYANQDRQADVTFRGTEGESCLPTPSEEGGGGGAVPDVPGSIGGPGFTDAGAVRQVHNQPTVCVRFHIVRDGWPDAGNGRGERPTAERLQQCLKAASGWFAGVDFEARPDNAAADEVETVGHDITDDPHCINIYIVNGQWFEGHPEEGDTPAAGGRKLGHTEGLPPIRPLPWVNDGAPPPIITDLTAAGVNAGYLNHLSAGLRITAEAGEDLCSTIAHELGHALGLGKGPNNTHLQPDNGQPISDDGHLMHPQGNGSTLSEKEQIVAQRMAQHLNENLLSKCDKSSRVIEDTTPDPPPTRSDFRSAGIFNQGETLRLVGTTENNFDPRSFEGRLIAEFDTNLDGAPDRRVVHTHANGEWEYTSDAPDTDSIPPLEPGFIVRTHTMPANRARGFVLEVPMEIFPTEAREIGWRMTLEIPGDELRSTIPADGFDRFDITRPDFAIAIAPTRAGLRAAPGGVLEFAGTAVTSSTFTGDVRLALMLSADQRVYRFPLRTLTPPVPDEWAAQVELPDSIQPGNYDLTLYAMCDACRLSTSVRSQVVVATGSSQPFWRSALFTIAILAVLITTWMELRRRRQQRM